MATQPVAPTRIYGHMVRGVSWAAASQWGLRIIGLVSTMIMARLLTPADFGIFAMAMMVRGLLDNFTRLGVAVLVIRERDSSRVFYDTAWTAQILQGLVIGLLLALVAPVAASYFTEPRVVAVMRVMAATAVIAGCVNIGIVLLRKELDFAKDFQFLMYKRLVTFVFTISLGIALRNYWAPVIGQLVAEIASLLISYRMHGYRPRLALGRARQFLRFATSVIPYNIGRFLNVRADALVVGSAGAAAGLGAYTVASELSSMFTRHLATIFDRGLLPNYAALVTDRPRLNRAFLTSLTSMWIVCLALGVGLAAVAPEFVAVLLGPQWDDAIPLLQWLAVYGILVCLIQALSGQILIVIGRERISAILMWVRLGLLVPLTVAALTFGEIETVAKAAALSAALALPWAARSLTWSLGVTWLDLASALWRPLSAAAAMYIVVSSVPGQFLPALPLLFLKTAIGAATYLLTLLAAWHIAGRPDGPESLLLKLAREKLRNNR